MPTLNLTEIVGEPRTWEGKQGGKFDSYKVKAEDGTVYEINVKHGNPPPKLGPDDFDVTPPKEGTSFPPKIKRQFSGGGGQRNAAKDAYWEAKEQRDIEGIARMGRAHAQEMAIRVAIGLGSYSTQPDERSAELRAVIKDWTDWFQQDVDASAPTTASPALPSVGQAPGPASADQHRAEGGDSARGFSSDKQKRFMESLLKKAGGSPETVGTILTYCSEALTPTDVSAAIDTLNSENSEAVRACAKELAKDANEWIVRDTPFPPDEADLPQVAA